MKYPCNIIQDLLPLYHDRVCSEESSEAVEAHLSECESCREQYHLLEDSDSLTPDASPVKEQENAEPLRKIKKSILKKRILACALSVLAAILVCTAGGMFLTSNFVAEPADIISRAELKDNALEISATSKRDGISSTTATLRENGKGISVLVCSIEGTLWESFTGCLKKPEPRTFCLQLEPAIFAEKEYKTEHDNLPDGTEIIRKTPVITNPEEVPQPFQRVYYYGKSLKEFGKKFSSKELTPDDVAGMTLLWSK